MSVALTAAWISSPGRSWSASSAADGDLGGDRQRSLDPDPDPIAEPVDLADRPPPDVASARRRADLPGEGDRLRAEDGERRSVGRAGEDDGRTVGRRQHVVGDVAVDQVGPDQLGDVARPRVGGDLGDRPDLDDPPGIEDCDSIGERVCVDRIVGDQQPHPVERLEMSAEIAPDLPTGADIECGERLVEQQQARIGGQRAGKGDALGLPTGQRPRPMRRMIGEPDPLQPSGSGPPGLGLGHPPGTQTEGDVLHRAEMREQQVVLEDDADRALLGGDEHLRIGIVEDQFVDPDPAAIECDQPGEDAQQGRLARPVGPEDRQHLARLDAQFEIEVETPEAQTDGRLEAHPAPGPAVPPSHRSRRPTRTTKETAISTRLRISASSGLVSNAR